MYNPIFLVVGDKRKNEEQNILILPVVHFIIPSIVIYSKNKKKVPTFLDKNTIRILLLLANIKYTHYSLFLVCVILFSFSLSFYLITHHKSFNTTHLNIEENETCAMQIPKF